MSDKSPKKSSSKTAASKTLKEKRADKKAKVASRAGNDVTDAGRRSRRLVRLLAVRRVGAHLLEAYPLWATSAGSILWA